MTTEIRKVRNAAELERLTRELTENDPALESVNGAEGEWIELSRPDGTRSVTVEVEQNPHSNPTTGELVMLPGTVLPNEAVVIAASASRAHIWTLLCLRPGRITDAYVTWECSRPSDGKDTHTGHYFDSLTDALADFGFRS